MKISLIDVTFKEAITNLAVSSARSYERNEKKKKEDRLKAWSVVQRSTLLDNASIDRISIKASMSA